MFRWVHRLREGVSALATAGCDLLFPPRCAHCERELPDGAEWLLCSQCLVRLAPATWRGCRRCGSEMPLEVDLAPGACPRCRDAALKFDATVALGSYQAGLRDVVLRMKRPAHETLSVAMGRLLVERRRGELLEHGAHMVVPVPMFWGRRLRRGINSPDIVACCLAVSLGIPVRRNVLVRCRNTLPQAHLSPRRRFENVRGAFRVRRPEAIRDGHVLLVDDILTTGATCSEAAKMLKQAGAASVVVAVIARAQGQGR
jgi:ComF family protein